MILLLVQKFKLFLNLRFSQKMKLDNVHGKKVLTSMLFFILVCGNVACENRIEATEWSSNSTNTVSDPTNPVPNLVQATPKSNFSLSKSIDFIQSIHLMGISIDVQDSSWDFSLYRNGKADYGYAYAPSTLYDHQSNKYFRYFCSSPGNNSDSVPTAIGWDYIRVVSSVDTVQWSAPKVVLYSKGTVQDLAACDPSVIKLNGYYYIFYSSWRTGLETFNAVARSKNPEGPFEVWREQNPNSPQGYWGSLTDSNSARPIQVPINSDEIDQGYDTSSLRSNYGLGQPSVIVINQEIHMWFVDDSRNLLSCKQIEYAKAHPKDCGTKVYYAISKDPVNWPRQPKTDTDFLNQDPRKMAVEVISSDVATMDVKYDPASKKFYMFYAGGAKGAASVLMQTSEDGIHWKNSMQIFGGTDCMTYGGNQGCPEYIGEVGAIGDENGFIIDGGTVLSMKVANDLDVRHNETQRCSVQSAPHCFGFWDLYDIGINLENSKWSPTLLALQNKKQKVGDSKGVIRTVENLPPTGSVKLINNTISGWAFDPDSAALPVKIQIFDEVGFATYTPISEFYTSLKPPLEIMNDFKDYKAISAATNLGFSWTVPDNYLDKQSHTLIVYAIDSKGSKHRHLGSFTINK